MNTQTKWLGIGFLVALAGVVGGAAVYQSALRPLRIALVGVSDADWGAWETAAQSTPYTLHRIERADVAAAPLGSYQVAVVWGMGFKPDEQQLAAFENARQEGTQLLVLIPTNDQLRQQATLPEEVQKQAGAYLRHGGEDNLTSLLHFLARNAAGANVEVPPLVEKPLDGLFHAGGTLFETLEDYESFLEQQKPKLDDKCPRLALFGPFLDPRDRLNSGPVDQLIAAFENLGVRVYPIFGRMKTAELLRSIKPDLALAFPHGRLAPGNQAVQLLGELDVPCLTVLSMNQPTADWRADERGMSGGFLGQSVVQPELDGAIEPLLMTALEPNERNLKVRTAIQDRFDLIVGRAMNWLELRRKPNAQKRVAIVYYKAPGASALSASGLEVAPSLLAALKRLQQEGYDLGQELPETPEALFELIQKRGRTLGQWALGSFEKFLAEASPELVPAEQYAAWFGKVLSERRRREIIERWGPIPGDRMTTQKDGKPYVVISRIQLGNVVIMPQPTVGDGGDEAKSIHGTDEAPPHFYLAAYLWARYGFQADAIVHFGTHGSLEFTKGKSVCLSRDCWPDILTGDLPHIYPYIVNNVGEALVAKRRSYATIVSHLTPPFTEANLYGELRKLEQKIEAHERVEDAELERELRRTITEMVRSLDLGKDIGLEADALSSRLLGDEELERLHNHMHELENERVTEGLYVLGRPYTPEQLRSSVALMLGEPAYATMLKAAGQENNRVAQNARLALARALTDEVLDKRMSSEQFFSASEIAAFRRAARRQATAAQRPSGRPAEPSATRSADAAKGRAASSPPERAADPPPALSAAVSTEGSAKTGTSAQAPIDPAHFWGLDKDSRPKLVADPEVRQAFFAVLESIEEFAEGLEQSSQQELDRIAAALSGRFIPPSSGGDPLFNPDSVPSGRNLYGVDPERMPTEEAWRIGQKLADEILAQHKAETGKWRKQVAISLWGGEFIRTEGNPIAQILYLMGVRPVHDSRGRVGDVEIIPSPELGRPRIDVLVQTSGQFRDAAASRITLIDKAVRLVNELGDEPYPNYVKQGTADTERRLANLGYAPKEARDWATARIFGSAGNQSYGTGIMGLVEKGDKWENEQEVADRYVQNMGGVYRDGETWGTYKPGLLEAQMQGTELVLHSRSSNTWGPLSLDHVYEFMGGITLAVRAKTGRDPVGYFTDLRTRGKPKATSAIAAIRTEARTTIWNPKFLSGLMREGPSAAGSLTETVRNLYGWNVMQPKAIDEGLWNETCATLIDDKHKLGIQQFFESKNPYALQDMTAIMLETARKGYWAPSSEMLARLASLHADLVARYGAACSYETCGNAKLREFIGGQLTAPGSTVPAEVVAAYEGRIESALEPSQAPPDVEGIELTEKQETIDEPRPPQVRQTAVLSAGVVFAILLLIAFGARPRQFRGDG